MVLDGQEIFLVTSVSVQVITLNVFSICYVCYADFSSLSMYFPLTLPLLHLLHLLQGIRWPSIFSCNHSQLFFIILCATFVTLIC